MSFLSIRVHLLHGKRMIIKCIEFCAITKSFGTRLGHKRTKLAIQRRGDMSMFYLCSFKVYQDTPLIDLNRQFYQECDVCGTVNFIFSDTIVVFQNYNLYSRLPMIGQANMMVVLLKRVRLLLSFSQTQLYFRFRVCNILIQCCILEMTFFFNRKWLN